MLHYKTTSRHASNGPSALVISRVPLHFHFSPSFCYIVFPPPPAPFQLSHIATCHNEMRHQRPTLPQTGMCRRRRERSPCIQQVSAPRTAAAAVERGGAVDQPTCVSLSLPQRLYRQQSAPPTHTPTLHLQPGKQKVGVNLDSL